VQELHKMVKILTNNSQSNISINVAVDVGDVALNDWRVYFGHSDEMNYVIVHHQMPARQNALWQRQMKNTLKSDIYFIYLFKINVAKGG